VVEQVIRCLKDPESYCEQKLVKCVGVQSKVCTEPRWAVLQRHHQGVCGADRKKK
jgi:hypothetical protein